jgi:hypothetical protein
MNNVIDWLLFSLFLYYRDKNCLQIFIAERMYLLMEKEICKRLCKKIGEDDLKSAGLSESSIEYFKSYGYEIWEPVEKDKYIYVFEPDDTNHLFAMEFLSYQGMDEAFQIWKDL